MTMADERGPGGDLESIPTLPVFFKLAGKRAVVAGGDLPTVWKTELLAATGAHVTVLAPDPCDALSRAAEHRGSPAVRLVTRAWVDADLDGAAIAIGSMATDGEAARFRDAARRAGVPVNVIDKPAFCDFQFGTLVSRGPLVVAVTTDGAAPVFGQAIRARLEAWLPTGLARWAQAAEDWRPEVQRRDWAFRQRRRFWERFADLALHAPDRPPDEADLAACRAAGDGRSTDLGGSVTLVGSGPGRPDSLTFEAARTLQAAEVLLFEAGLAPALVALARREAARFEAADDAETAEMALEHARAGKRVVWLGSGNPTVCRRWRLRADAVIRGGLEPDTIAGLSVCSHCAGACPEQRDRGVAGP